MSIGTDVRLPGGAPALEPIAVGGHARLVSGSDSEGLSGIAADVVQLGRSQVRLVPGVLADECRLLFEDWQQSPGRQAY